MWPDVWKINKHKNQVMQENESSGGGLNLVSVGISLHDGLGITEMKVINPRG